MAPHPLDSSSSRLIEQVDKELTRPPATTGSHLVGGLTLVGARLDDLMRSLLVEACALRDEPPESFLPKIHQRTVDIRRATAGQLLNAARRAAEGVDDAPTIRLLITDARRRPSRLSLAIEARNEAAHGGEVPPHASKALQSLRTLLVEYRRDAGWEVSRSKR